MKTVFRTALALVLMFYAENLFSQTYSGNYRLEGVSSGMTGVATYDYKEVDDERIKEGKFTYSHTDYLGDFKMTGTYKEGQKNGHWCIESMGRKGSGYQLQNYRKGKVQNALVKNDTKTVMEGDYVEDKKEGKWTLTQTDRTYGYKGVANFCKGLLCGAFEATASYKHHNGQLCKYSLKGQFAEGGLPDSLWTAKWTDDSGVENLLKMTFKNGRFVSLVAKDLSTGANISENYAMMTFVSGLYANNGMGIRKEDTSSLPDVFSKMLGIWTEDETLMTKGKEEAVLYLDWNR